MTHDYRQTPSVAYRYWLHDPDGLGLLFFRSKEDRLAAYTATLDAWRGEGDWPEEVTHIYAGEVTHLSTEIDRIDRPPSEQLIDGEDQEGRYWEDHCDYVCNYALTPLPEESSL